MVAQLSVIISKQMNDIIEDAVGKTEENVKSFMKETYDDLVARSPAITNYYKSNHRIGILNSSFQFKTQGGAKLFPPIKDSEEPGVYAGNVAATRAEELAKLDGFELGDIVRISTAVPYADSVEQKHGTYRGANAIAGALLKRLET